MGRGVCENSNIARGSRVIVAVAVRLAAVAGVVWNGCELMSLGEIQLATITITKMQKTLSFFIS